MTDLIERFRKLQADAGIPHLPTELTYECRMAVSGEGPRAFDWSNKPHRLVYDLSREVERLTAELAAARATLAQYKQAPVGLGDHVRVKQLSSDSDPKWLNDWRFPMDGSPAWHGHVIGLYMDYLGQIEATVTDEYCPEFPHRHARSGSTDGFPLSVLERVPPLIARPEASK